jgi:hypothetical protein
VLRHRLLAGVAGVVVVALVVAAVIVIPLLAGTPTRAPTVASAPRSSASASATPSASPSPTPTPSATPIAPPAPPPPPASRQYPLHTGIVSTTFWVGEIFDPNAADGSQMISTYDSDWFGSYGGCDGVVTGGGCETEARTAGNGFFPTQMTPRQNPFYLDLPFDDVNDSTARAMRQSVIPWAGDPAYRGAGTNENISLMKNRWVRISANGQTCYGQIEDAGPGEYHDAAYVFGTGNTRPANKRYNGAGMDVSPALNGCLHFAELDGQDDVVSWQFVEASEVPPGPWKRIVTTSGVR